jgi:hypothetical protein
LFSARFTGLFVSFLAGSCFESLGFEMLEFADLEFTELGRAIELASSPWHLVQFERIKSAPDRKQTDNLTMVCESIRIRLI